MNKSIILILLVPSLVFADTVNIVPTSDVSNAWDSGTYADIDEGIDTPNYSDFITVFEDGFVVRFVMANPGLVDGDTITAVKVKVRAKDNDSSNRINFRVYIGGVSKGESQINTTTTITDYTVTNAGWDLDWTAAQLNGMEVWVESAGSGATGDYWIYALDVEITYTAAGGGASNIVKMVI
jgi:hypothetical protein